MSKTINITDAPFYGRTSRMPGLLGAEELDCRHCGSSLRGRHEDRRPRRFNGIVHLVDVYLCGCGRRRLERVEGGRA